MGHKQKPFWSRNTFCQIQSLGQWFSCTKALHAGRGTQHCTQKDTHFDTLCLYCLLKGIMPSNHSQAWKTPAVALWKSKIASGTLYISREYHSESEEGLSCLPRLIAVQSWWLLSPVFWARAREPAAIWSPPSGAPQPRVAGAFESREPQRAVAWSAGGERFLGRLGTFEKPLKRHVYFENWVAL